MQDSCDAEVLGLWVATSASRAGSIALAFTLKHYNMKTHNHRARRSSIAASYCGSGRGVMAPLLCRICTLTALLSRRGFCFLLGEHVITPLCPSEA